MKPGRQGGPRETPNKIGNCMGCGLVVKDDGPKAGKLYGHGFIHDSCYREQQKQIQKWKKNATA